MRKEALRIERLTLLELGDYSNANLILLDIQKLNRKIYPEMFG